MKNEPALTHQRLKEILSYCPDTGVFVRLSGRANEIGRSVGCPISKNRRYLIASVDGGRYRMHNLAWFYVHGVWPSQEIDHINRDPQDNRIANLRDVSRSENLRNRSWKPQSVREGVAGFSKKRNKYRAQITVDGRSRHLGVYATPEEAHRAFCEARTALRR